MKPRRHFRPILEYSPEQMFTHIVQSCLLPWVLPTTLISNGYDDRSHPTPGFARSRRTNLHSKIFDRTPATLCMPSDYTSASSKSKSEIGSIEKIGQHHRLYRPRKPPVSRVNRRPTRNTSRVAVLAAVRPITHWLHTHAHLHRDAFRRP